MKLNSLFSVLLLIIMIGTIASCKKLTQVPEPVNTVTTAEAFSSDATATATIIGLYNDLINGHDGPAFIGGFFFGNGAITVSGGLSADELHQSGSNSLYETNTLNANNFSAEANALWSSPYFDIYIANAAINQLPLSKNVSSSTKQQLMGEAYFFRAFCNFYLVNMFGGIPLAKTTTYAQTDTLHRASISAVYQQIISDLTEAEHDLSDGYSISGGDRVRVNKAGATALLARVYLYRGDLTHNQDDYKQAETQATTIIRNTGLYSLQSDLNQVFLPNSSEAILQLPPNQYPFVTKEGSEFIPFNDSSRPDYYLTDQLVASFEAGDQRKTAWLNTTSFAGTVYYYPFKYKVRTSTTNTAPEWYMVLRLAEQYLIRAEARAQQNELMGANGAISDINAIRARAGLLSLSSTLTQSGVLAAVAQERKIELFAEWGHRWFDLKRTGQANTVLSADKGHTLTSNALLYPIPAVEIVNNANLVQNPGY